MQEIDGIKRKDSMSLNTQTPLYLTCRLCLPSQYTGFTIPKYVYKIVDNSIDEGQYHFQATLVSFISSKYSSTLKIRIWLSKVFHCKQNQGL